MEFIISRISRCRNKMQTRNGKMKTALCCTESIGTCDTMEQWCAYMMLRWRNHYPIWSCCDANMNLIFMSPRMMEFITFIFVHDEIHWSCDNTTKAYLADAAKVDLVLSRWLLWQHAENLTFINALYFAARYEQGLSKKRLAEIKIFICF